MIRGHSPAMEHGEHETKGKYRINVVAEMTGVSAATLRAWERRYGFPVPSRTASSYRIYTDRDVALIRRMQELCEQGMSPADAASAVLAEPTAEPAASLDVGDPFAPFHERIVVAVQTFDPSALERAVEESMVLGPATTIFDRVFAPAMAEIGARWEAGTLSVAQEHLASVVLESSARKLLGLVQPRTDRRILLACFAEEEHSFPLYGVALHAASWGFSVVFLGARTPPDAIAHAVRRLGPVLVGLSVTMAPPMPEARALVEGYASACGALPWLVGGGGASRLRGLVEDRGGVVIEDWTPLQVLRTVNGLIASGRGRSSARKV
jgi:MerR family transcriptional regulator, light-induced transcriptional regulator